MIIDFFFFNDTATTEIYTLSLHDALPISRARWMAPRHGESRKRSQSSETTHVSAAAGRHRSEEHTSELQSRLHLVCRLLLEKKTHEKTTSLSRAYWGSPTS